MKILTATNRKIYWLTFANLRACGLWYFGYLTDNSRNWWTGNIEGFSNALRNIQSKVKCWNISENTYRNVKSGARWSIDQAKISVAFFDQFASMEDRSRDQYSRCEGFLLQANMWLINHVDNSIFKSRRTSWRFHIPDDFRVMTRWLNDADTVFRLFGWLSRLRWLLVWRYHNDQTTAQMPWRVLSR